MPTIWDAAINTGSEVGAPSFLTSTCESQNQIDGVRRLDSVLIGIENGNGIRYATVHAEEKKLGQRLLAVSAAGTEKWPNRRRPDSRFTWEMLAGSA